MAASIPLTDDRTSQLLIRVGVVWHGLLAPAAAAGAALVGFGRLLAADTALWLRILAVVLMAAVAIGSGFAAFYLYRRKLPGRTISLVINFLLFLFFFFGLLQLVGFFVGIDALAATFGRGIPWLGGVLAGYLVGSLNEKLRSPWRERAVTAGKWIAAASFVVFLLQIGLLQGAIYILRQLGSPVPLAFAVASLLTGVMVWALGREKTGIEMRATNASVEGLEGYLFLSPNFLGFLFFFAGPLLLSLYVSFTDWDAFGTKNWIGFANYARIFHLSIAPLVTAAQPAAEVLDLSVFNELTRFTIFGSSFVIGAADQRFWISMGNTLVFCLLSVPLSVIPALLLANVLNSKIPGMKIFRALYFIPSIAATVGVALIWQWLYNASIGWINYFVTLSVDFLNSFGMQLVDPKIAWLSESRTALLAIVIMSAWQKLGFNTVLILAGLQNIPKELYEAAVVDGANRWQKFWHMTLPLLRPTTFFVVTTTTIGALQVFEQVFIMTNPPGGPNNATLTAVLYLYQNGFQRFNQGYASAVAWVLFLVIFIVTLLQFRGQRNTGSYDV